MGITGLLGYGIFLGIMYLGLGCDKIISESVVVIIFHIVNMFSLVISQQRQLFFSGFGVFHVNLVLCD